MLRFIFLVALVSLVVAMITRSRSANRIFWTLLGVSVVYTLLKLSGVIEALAPDRTGVF
jgi:hypothetical protein